MTKELQFTVDSALLKELGEKLVETVHLALSELVKNSYDADATEVEVVFDTNENGGNRIKIVDNGTGMNFKAVQNYWMRIATTNKKKQDVSSIFGRHLTGAKGIGRFSCRRLGSKLTLITTGTGKGNLIGKQKNVQKTIVEFPWLNFEAGTDVTEIKCPGEQTVLKEGYTGTTLIIDDISDEWSSRGLNWLKRQLAVLSANRGTKRKGFKDDPGFLVMLSASDFEGGIRDIREDLINSGWGTLTAYVNSKHQAVCELNALGLGRRTITSNISFSDLSDVKLKIGIMVESRLQMRDTSVVSQTSLNEILPQWGGVQIRYRNFRVFPYGDDDWLNLDRDRGLRKGAPGNELLVFAESLKGVDASRSLLNMLSMRNYVGSVDVGENAAGFEMKVNREGFLESKSVHQLKDFVRFAIDWSTILRDYFLRQETQRQAILAKEDFEDVVDKKIETSQVVESALDYINTEVRLVSRELPPEKRIEVEESLNKATEAIRKHNESINVELAHLRLIASTSTLLLIFSHEVKSLLGLLEQSKNTLHRIAKTLDKKNQGVVNDIATNFSDLNLRLEELLQLTSLVSNNKMRNQPGRIALKAKIKKVEKVFELITNKYSITIDYENVPNNIVIKRIMEAELYSILLNVLSNSIKAVIAGGRRSKKIKIDAKTTNGDTIISIRDTGIGLSEKRFNEVFIPFVSDPDGKLYKNLDKRLNPEDSMIVGTGSGLGLGIVKEIINAHGGVIAFKKPLEGWSSEIEIRLQ
ncbi:ATP-binding protein [Flagellimonas sp.]|uniref:ATP-binding protein n=1 Tax=Flagellimonas sp. TaxID=2058762 RepID=UPI003B5127F2